MKLKRFKDLKKRRFSKGHTIKAYNLLILIDLLAIPQKIESQYAESMKNRLKLTFVLEKQKKVVFRITMNSHTAKYIGYFGGKQILKHSRKWE